MNQAGHFPAQTQFIYLPAPGSVSLTASRCCSFAGSELMENSKCFPTKREQNHLVQTLISTATICQEHLAALSAPWFALCMFDIHVSINIICPVVKPLPGFRALAGGADSLGCLVLSGHEDVCVIQQSTNQGLNDSQYPSCSFWVGNISTTEQNSVPQHCVTMIGCMGVTILQEIQ